jgi:LacI family gluconate utilization system Gnt-I transcriptional repressor
MTTRKPPTMRDVARLAGVAPMTVSRALRDGSSVHAETREAIRRAVKELGYVTNLAASALSARGSKQIGLVVPNVSNSVFAETIEGLSSVLAPAGYSLCIAYSGYDRQTEEQQVRGLLSYKPDAIILTGFTHTTATRTLLRTVGIPVVEFWNIGPEPIDMAVGFSNYQGALEMTRYLIDRGARRLGYIGGTQTDNDRTQAREEGFRQALASAGLPAQEAWISSETIAYSSGSELARRFVASPKNARPEAWFAASDIIAAGFIFECQRLGINVPGDVAVAGFDDTALAGAMNPQLTTVRIPQRRIGTVTGELLLARLRKKPIEQSIVNVGFELIMRETA